MKILSFIIPSFNVEWCLHKALNSMLVQDILQDIEIIVVNDGSTDKTEEIATQYVRQYPQNVILVNKSNGGHGSAINSAISYISGTYFKVVDADDWVISENLPEFVNILKDCTCDVVLTPYHRIDMKDGSRESWNMYCDNYKKVYSLEDIVADWKKFDRCCMFHGISYRTEFYRYHNYQLPEKIFYEDHEFSSIPFCYADSIYPINIYVYQYLVGNSEQSVSDKNKLARLSHAEKVTRDLLIYRREHFNLTSEGMKYLDLKIESGIPSYYETVCIVQRNKKKGRKDMDQFNAMIQSFDPAVYQRVLRKSQIYRLLSWLHLTPTLYRKMLYSGLYSKLRKTNRLEKE